MKKTLILMVVISIFTSLVSCSSNSNQSITNENSNPNLELSDTKNNVENTDTENETQNNSDFESKYIALEIGPNDYVSGAAHNVDIKLISQEYISNNIGDAKKVSINNQEFSVEYYGSNKGYLYNDDKDCYQKITDNEYIEIYINNNKNRIDFYNWISKNYMDSKVDKEKLSSNDCQQIAMEHLNQYIDVDEYELLSVDYKEFIEIDGIYKFNFARVIDGIMTFDQATISVTVYGDVISHNFFCLGELKDAPIPTPSELIEIDKVVDEKIESIYKNISKKFSIEYEIDSKYIVKHSDGRYAMEYSLDVDIIPFSKDEESISERVNIMVYI